MKLNDLCILNDENAYSPISNNLRTKLNDVCIFNDEITCIFTSICVFYVNLLEVIGKANVLIILNMWKRGVSFQI